jgi:hypothetical protein
MNDRPSHPEAHEDQGHDEWDQRYRDRGDLVLGALADLIRESLEGRDLLEAKRWLRERRAGFDHGFCLLLYGSGPDEALAREIHAQMAQPPGEDEMRTAIELVGHPERNSRVMTILMVLLEHELGMQLVMLERPSEQPPEGPIRIRAPDEFWFQSFGLVAELARAIIVIGNLGVNLIHELRYLRDAGLSGRVLVYADATLHGFEEGKDLDEQMSWPVSSEGVRAGVLHAAAAEAIAPRPQDAAVESASPGSTHQ